MREVTWAAADDKPMVTSTDVVHILTRQSHLLFFLVSWTINSNTSKKLILSTSATNASEMRNVKRNGHLNVKQHDTVKKPNI